MNYGGMEVKSDETYVIISSFRKSGGFGWIVVKGDQVEIAAKAALTGYLGMSESYDREGESATWTKSFTEAWTEFTGESFVDFGYDAQIGLYTVKDAREAILSENDGHEDVEDDIKKIFAQNIKDFEESLLAVK